MGLEARGVGSDVSSGSYRADVDGLRALAVVGVLLFHGFPRFLPSGFIGVDIFFVISGFLITRLLVTGPGISIPEFYLRRARRLFPALALVLASVLLLGWSLMLPGEFRLLGKHTLASGLFSTNLVLWRETGYFDVTSDTKPLRHLWSLGVEEQYYLAWPLFVALLRNTRRFVAAVVVSAAASFVANLWATAHHPAAAFYLPVTRYWELALGGMVAIWSSRTPGDSRHSPTASWVGGLLVLGSFVVISDQHPFPGAWAALPTVGTALLIAGGPRTTLARALGARPLVAIGLVSYPLYLWHWPLLSFGYILVGNLSPGRVALLLALSAVLATGTFQLVEKKVRAGRTRWAHPAFLAGAVAALAVAGGTTMAARGFPARTALNSPPVNEDEPTPSRCPAALQRPGKGSIEYCRLAGEGSPPRAAVLGDSHADHLFDGLVDTHAPWLLLGHSSCPPLAGVHILGVRQDCDETFQRILDYLRSPESASIRTLFVTFYAGYAVAMPSAANQPVTYHGPDGLLIGGSDDIPTRVSQFEQGLEAYLVALLATGRRVVLVEDVPEFPFLPSRCATPPPLGQHLRALLGGVGDCSLQRATVDERQSWYLAMTARLAQRHPEVSLIHTLDYVCTKSTCQAIGPQGDLLYADRHHLSPAGARILAPVMMARAFGSRDALSASSAELGH
jgi:peptidoglycan/LPS O-acetylase OafA/YrhL